MIINSRKFALIPMLFALAACMQPARCLEMTSGCILKTGRFLEQ